MAIYHFSAKVISRASGSSALAAAAYRSASRLHDQRLDRHHDFSNKAGVVHSEVLLPEGAPEHLADRERLWNDVEAAEVRKDAQLAREVEFALPRELDEAEGIRLARDFVEREFVSRGMIADLNVHWDIGAEGTPKPHAHVMLSMREVGEDVHAAATREAAREALIDSWDRDRREAPKDSRIVLTHTNDDVRALNEAARGKLREAGELGDEVRLSVTRGTRDFASGDRVMFLRNERSMGVKNGSLGTVRSVDAMRMQVMLDDGRSVAFDHKDYADLDHGYAATIHKAQGMTVDRVHVLATPGMDRHAAYVALSRHRDQVDLHYGRDEFGDEKKLMRALSRERGKDMASDYAVERVRAPEPPAQKRDIFAGLKLRASPGIERAAPDPLAQAVERFGRAAQDIARMREQGYDMLPHQREALLKAKDELEALRPDAGNDLRVAMNQDHSLIGEAAAGKTQRAIRAMTMQRDLRIDAANRADQFVADWQAKARMMKQLERSGAYGELGRVKESMAEMSKSLQRDPQLESLLRNRHKELGIKASKSASLSHDLQQWLGRSRSRGLEL